jgi:chemotaxis protein MotB
MSSLFDEEPEHDDSERWLLTYADMITLLLALFIVMFAMSSVNATKFQSLQQSLEEALRSAASPSACSPTACSSTPAPPTSSPPPRRC